MAHEIPSLDSLNLNLNLSRDTTQPPVSQAQVVNVAEQILPQQEAIANRAIAREQETTNTMVDLNSINEQLQQELSNIQIAKVEQAELKKANTLASQESDDFDVNVYNQSNNSETAKRQQLNAVTRVQQKTTELNKLREESAAGGFVTRFVNTFRESSVKNELLEAQQELNNVRVGQVTAGQVMNAELSANAIAASKLTTAETAQVTLTLETAQAHAARLSSQGKLTKDELDSLAIKARIDQATMASLNEVLTTLQKTNSLSQASAAAAYQKAQLDSFLLQETRRQSNASSKDAYWTQRQTDFDAFLNQMGRETDVGKISIQTLSEEARQSGVITDATLQRFVSWDTLYNTMGKGAYSNALLKQQQNVPMSMAEKNDLSLGQKLASKFNAQLQAEASARIKRVKPGANSKAEETTIKNEVQAQLIDPNSAEGISRVNQILDSHKLEANEDITGALATGNIVTLPLQTLQSDTTTAGYLNKFANRAGQELMLTDGWKDIQFQINPADPTGSVNATFDQLVAQIEKATSEASDQQALADTLGGVAEGYYRTTVKYSANAMGYPLLNAWKMGGIDTGEGGLGGFGGLRLQPSLKVVDLFNGAKISTIIKSKLRARRLQRSPATAASLLRN